MVAPAHAWPFPTGNSPYDDVNPARPVTKRAASGSPKIPTKRTSGPITKAASPKAPTKAAGPATKRVTRKPSNHRAAWDAEADNQLIINFVAGQTPAALAKTCGRTKASVAGRLHALGFLVFDKDTLTYSTAPKFWFKVV